MQPVGSANSVPRPHRSLYGSDPGVIKYAIGSPQGFNVPTDEGASGDAGRRVILFRPRAGAPPTTAIPAPSWERDVSSPVSDLTKFERTQEQDDYRHRMIVNAVALVFTILLAAAGIWLAESMAALRKNQDCVLMGRRGCSPIELPAADRWSGSVSDQR